MSGPPPKSNPWVGETREEFNRRKRESRQPSYTPYTKSSPRKREAPIEWGVPNWLLRFIDWMNDKLGATKKKKRKGIPITIGGRIGVGSTSYPSNHPVFKNLSASCDGCNYKMYSDKYPELSICEKTDFGCHYYDDIDSGEQMETLEDLFDEDESISPREMFAAYDEWAESGYKYPPPPRPPRPLQKPGVSRLLK